jgi:MFS family permease
MQRNELWLGVYLPTMLLALGQGALLATLPLYADELGFGYTLVAVVSAAAAMGTLVTDVPAGAAIHRIGMRRSMFIGTGLVAASTFPLVLDLDAGPIIALRIVAGIGTAMWGLSRHSFIATAIPIASRGQAIATFGGVNRIGVFGGPALGGAIGTIWGLQSTFVLTGVMALLALITVAIALPNTEGNAPRPRGGARQRWSLVRMTVRENSRDLAAAGIAQLFAQMIRQGRQLLIPLLGANVVGLSAAEVGLVMTISAVVDMSMFFPAGYLMDKFGRKFATVPSFAIMGIGLALLPFATSFATMAAIGILIGLGNGLGSGSMMTLGADLAPEGATGEFLGIWRLIGDVGMVAGPLLVGVIAANLDLDTSAIVLGVAGVTSSLMFLFLVKETRVGTEPGPAVKPM